MTEIQLYNSATRQKEVFKPLDPENVRLYVCGPTVYDRAHIGNARPAVVFDVLYRLLRHEYGADHVTYVRNITDIEDKIMVRAKERGVPIDVITEETIGWYREDMAALGTLPPTHEPRATDYVGQMIAMIEALIAKGHAYEAEGHVLFEVGTYPAYGMLSGRSTDDMIAGARVEIAPYKRDPMDFVLWKPSSDNQPGWDSPWGRGRPGWHIECSAMSSELLGNTFDIHGGGSDLQFPHHENEIAQSCCAHPDAGFAKLWMHNGMINVDGRKMSKSLGNFLTVEDLRNQAPDLVLRLAMLMTHYRGTLDWTSGRIQEAYEKLKEWSVVTALHWSEFDTHPVTEVFGTAPSQEVVEALCDDLNTPDAIAHIDSQVTAARTGDEKAQFQFIADARLLGFLSREIEPAFMLSHSNGAVYTSQILNHFPEAVKHVDDLRDHWHALRTAKKFEEADQLKAALLSAGVELRARAVGPFWSAQISFDAVRVLEIEP